MNKRSFRTCHVKSVNSKQMGVKICKTFGLMKRVFVFFSFFLSFFSFFPMVELKFKKPTINQTIFFILFYFIIIKLYIIFIIIFFYQTNAFTRTKFGVDTQHTL